MNKYIEKPLDFLLFTNLFVAFAAVVQSLIFYHLFQLTPSYVVLAFLFCATILIYNISILIQPPKNYQISKYKRVRWIFGHFKLNISITILAACALIPLFFHLFWQAKLLVAVLALPSLGYALPIFTFKGKKVGLRKISGLKLFLIAFVWAISVTLLPYFELEKQQFSAISTTDIFILILQRFLFFAAITIPFDIRDMFQDQAFSLKTIPILLGEKKAYLFCQIMLFLSLTLLFIFQSAGFSINFFASALTIILAGWLIFKSKWEKNEYYYFFYLDGMLIVQYAMLLLFNSIFN
jgi:4-hydroxybenzoate polyprenyltransferase